MVSLDRREFCAGLGAVAAAAAMGGIAKASTRKQPNMIFILCDDLGWGDLECFNALSAIPTPNANRLAGQGMRWTDMHSGDAVCTPSRYGVLTGRYCWRSRLKKGVLVGHSPNLIEMGRMTVASMLKERGYYTAGFGKWHLGLGDQPVTDYGKPLRPGPIDHGFDYYYGIPASLDENPFLFFENDHVVEAATSYTYGCHFDANAPQIPQSEFEKPSFPPMNSWSPQCKTPQGTIFDAGPMAPHFKFEQVLPTIVDKTISAIHERAAQPEQPFFFYVPLPAPHDPWLPLPEYQGKSRAGKYGDYVVEVDAMLGKIMTALEQNGFSDNTLLIFTSDNGADWRPDNINRFCHRANGHWRGRKADIWEAGHRIPFIARWPGHIPAGTVCDELGCLIDFMATAAAIEGINLPRDAAEDSFNLLPALLGQTKKPVREAIVNHSYSGYFGIRKGEWKLEEVLGSGGFSLPNTVTVGPRGPKGQLYDLANDPREENNLYQKRPDIVEKLAKLLDTYQQQGYSRPM